MRHSAGGRQGSPPERLINGNLRLVLSVMQRFTGRGENLDDLFQVGCIGLIKAIDNFDISQNVRFSTYGVPMIIGEIRRYLRDNNAIRVSRSVRDTAYKAMQVTGAAHQRRSWGGIPPWRRLPRRWTCRKEDCGAGAGEPSWSRFPCMSRSIQRRRRHHLCDGSGGRDRL